jgi:hypothetical protein
MSNQLQQLLCQLPYLPSPVKGGLTALIGVLVASLIFFIWKKPGRATPETNQSIPIPPSPGMASLGTGNENLPTSDFAVIWPQAGDTVTKGSIIAEGVGIRPDLSYAMTVSVSNDSGMEKTYKHGDRSLLEVDADRSWRFKYIDFQSPGQYRLTFNAVLNCKSISRTFHVSVKV